MKEKESISKYVKEGWCFGAFSGIFNGITNLFVMYVFQHIFDMLEFDVFVYKSILIIYKFIGKE